jgi:ribose transport system ATP-binding protein
METKEIVSMEHITKSFPGVKALDNISININQGEIHALVGENGAGKSTLMKILGGAHIADSGKIKISGKEINNPTPAKMLQAGIAVIYQEFILTENMTVAENIFLGRYLKNSVGFVDYPRILKESEKICDNLHLDLDCRAKIKDLSVAKKQMVEIAKAMSRNAKVIVLDEPTAVLGEKELEGTFSIIKSLSKKGISFIYISHRLEEVFKVADFVTILKDGKHIITDNVRKFNTKNLVTYMVGRELDDIYPPRHNNIKNIALEVKNLSVGFVRNINFTLRKGEILGLAGLAGAGRTEILRAIISADKKTKGEILINGKRLKINSPKDALKNGIGLLPEERKTQGLFLSQNVIFNIGISRFSDFMKLGLIFPKKENSRCRNFIKRLNIKPSTGKIITGNMSGGNQQKVVFSKLLNAKCDILLIDEPTRGVDVGAKQEIYKIINKLSREGTAIIMVSSELPELLGISNKILVMHEGRGIKLLETERTSEEEIMLYATAVLSD